jgi:hypothetical protein
MTIPTKEWFPTSITGDLGSYQGWNGTPIDAEVMILALLAKLKVFVKSDVQFDVSTIFTQATSTSDNIPRAQKATPVTGTSSTTGFTQAQSTTFNFKTLINGDAKLVLLDTPIGSGGFNALHPAGFDSSATDLEAVFTDVANAWSGRDDSRPAILRKITFDLNEKLQKEYRMGQ